MTDLTTTDPGQPEPGAARDNEAPPAAQRPPPPGTSIPILSLTLLALTLALGAAGGALWAGWHQADDNTKQTERLTALSAEVTRQHHLLDTALDRRIDTLNRQLTDQLNRSQTDLAQRLTDMDAARQAVASRQDDLHAALTRIRSIANRGADAWVLAEAQYLMRIGNHRWQLQHDADTAIIALRAADARLRSLADPGLTPVRQQLVADINTLNALPNPDIDGLAASLSSIATQTMTLPLPGHARRPARNTSSQAADNATAAADLWERLLTLLTSSVELRRQHDQIMPLLSPEAEFNLRQNVQLKLESARLNLLRRNAPQLRADLNAALTWLDQYFHRNHPALQAARAELTRIAAIDIALPTVDIAASLRLLRTHMAAGGSLAAADGPPEAAKP